MWTIVITLSVIWIAFFIWARIDSKRRKKEYKKKSDKPPFRSEADLKEYAKPMEDDHQARVDFDDAE